MPAPRQSSKPVHEVDDVVLPPEYAEISRDEYDALAAIWLAKGKQGDPPMNPGQRRAVADFYRVVVFRSVARADGRSAVDIANAVRLSGYSMQMLLIGMGGTGKSRVITDLECRVMREGCQHRRPSRHRR